MLVVSIGFYLILSFLASVRIFHKISLTKWTALFFLCTIFFNMLIIEILSLFNAINEPVIYLCLQALFCLTCAILFLDPWKKIFKQPFPKIQFDVERVNGMEVILSIMILLILVGSLIVGFLSPINNSDSLHTHLPRIYYWLQHGSLERWNSNTTAQVNYPIIIPAQGLWLFLFSHNEKYFFLVQWFSMLVSVCLIYRIAILLGAVRKQALFASLISLSYPIILLQAFSLQGDIFVAAVLLSCVYFLLLYIQGNKPIYLFFSGISLAISLGAKQTAYLFLPAYVLVVVFLLIKKAVAYKTVLYTVLASLIVFMVCSSYMLIPGLQGKENKVQEAFGTTRYSIPFSRGTSLRGYVINTMRYLYQWVSLDGMNGQMKLDSLQIKNEVFLSIAEKTGLNLETHEYLSFGDEDYFIYDHLPVVNEDAAWYGVLSWILIPIALIVALTKKDKVVRNYALGSIGLLWIYFFSIAVLIVGWSPTNGRYLIIPIILASPLIALLVPMKRGWQKLLTILVALFSIYLSFSILLTNESRPIITTSTLNDYFNNKIDPLPKTNKLFRLYRAVNYKALSDLNLTALNRASILEGLYYERLFFQSTSEVNNIELVNSVIPADAPIYLRIKGTVLEYALFGINRTRAIYPIQSLEMIPPNSYLLVSKSLLSEIDNFGLMLQAENAEYMIFLKE